MSKNRIDLAPEYQDALRAVIDYLWDAERADCDANPTPNHIFGKLTLLRELSERLRRQEAPLPQANDVQVVDLSEPDFINDYPCLPNHLNPNAWPCRFGTEGEELAFVKQQNPRSVWTHVEYDGLPYILSGFHSRNAIGYYVSNKPLPEGIAARVNPASYIISENRPDPRSRDSLGGPTMQVPLGSDIDQEEDHEINR
jgi:hypothetical protein